MPKYVFINFSSLCIVAARLAFSEGGTFVLGTYVPRPYTILFLRFPGSPEAALCRSKMSSAFIVIIGETFPYLKFFLISLAGTKAPRLTITYSVTPRCWTVWWL